VDPAENRSTLVDLSSVSHPEYQHEQLAVMDFVDHAVVTGADAPLSGTPDEASRIWRSRVLGQEFDHGLDPTPDIGVTLAELSCGRW